MAERRITTFDALLAILLIGVIAGGFVWAKWEEIKPYLGIEGAEQYIATETMTQTAQTGQEAGAGAGEVHQEVPEVPRYQLTSVKLQVRDALDKKTAITGETIYVYEMGVNPADPEAIYLDYATTDSSGVAEFTAGKIFTGTDYQYVLKGSAVYDVIEVRSIPAPARYFGVFTHTFKTPMFAYKVGNFSDIGSDQTINITANPGIYHLEFDITIAEEQAGKVVKDPVLLLRVPEGKDLASGCIKSIYFVHKSGSSLGLPLGDVKAYIDGVPIKLTGVLPGYLTVNDKEVVTVKITVDNSICTAGSALDIALDDLGGYRARDVASLKLGADTEYLRISFVA